MPSEDEEKIMNDILSKYKKRLDGSTGNEVDENPASDINFDVSKVDAGDIASGEYEKFKLELLPKHMGYYEKACNFAESIFKIAPDKKKLPELQEAIEVSHLRVTPTGVYSFSLLAPIVIIISGMLLSMVIPMLVGKEMSSFFIVFSLIAGAAIMFPLQKLPSLMANTWRLNASNQMVLCIFYVVTYMRHTSNLERAIRFSSDHLTGPLSLDLKKVLWDVETQKYSNIKESLDAYLGTWRKWNMEFIEAFHLIESSLFESSEARRLSMLDKSLDVILDETYEKMLHYAQNLKGPITSLHMLGVILPILGLVLLPLIVSFMGGVGWYHISAIYNVTIPIAVYLLGRSILSSRPSGYGAADITDSHPELKRFKKINLDFFGQKIDVSPLYLCLGLGLLFVFIGLLPLIMHFVGMPDIGFGGEDFTTGCGYEYCLMDYREPLDGSSGVVGPYSLIAALFSFCFPISMSVGIGLYFKLKSKDIIKLREKAKELEKEFASGLFQLGNRLGDGIPAEIAFSKVADVMTGTRTGTFFEKISSNINELGMSVEEAIFDRSKGAIADFPSNMIKSSMKVLTESSKKGPKIAAQALVNVSRYIKEMHRVDERLKDLLADIISSMKSQISMLTPAIAGIVIGITSMITNILGKLGPMLADQGSGADAMGAGSSVTQMFGLGVPSYFFQAVVGIYVAQLIFVLTILTNGIENGFDQLNQEYLLGKNMLRSVLMYAGLGFVIMLAFNLIASIVLAGVLQV